MNTNLRALTLFSDLSDATLQDIERTSEVQEYADGDVIFREGDACTGMHVVLDGTVKLFRDREGREQIMNIQTPGHALATTPLLDQKPYPLSARAIGAIRALFTPIAACEQMFNQQVDFRHMLIADLTARHRNALALLNTIALKPVIARVATLIVQTATTANALDGSREFEMPLPQQQLANEVATTREGVARSLARLRREGVIAQQGSRIRVLDTDRLVKWAESTSSRSTEDEQMLAI